MDDKITIYVTGIEVTEGGRLKSEVHEIYEEPHLMKLTERRCSFHDNTMQWRFRVDTYDVQNSNYSNYARKFIISHKEYLALSCILNQIKHRQLVTT